MKTEKLYISGIPALVCGEKSDRVYLYVHGKSGYKEYAEEFAIIAAEKGYQTISFDLPAHGERKNLPDRCDIWNGMRDLKHISDYTFANWSQVSLYACSIGAFFSLNTYSELPFKNCLLQSPIVNLKYLIEQMFMWFNVTPEQLKAEGEIETPAELLSWKYYTYVIEHPIEKWGIPTTVLYAGKDNLQSEQVVREFCDKFNCELTVSPDSLHPFMEKRDRSIVQNWFRSNI